jgi:hypothetical protein
MNVLGSAAWQPQYCQIAVPFVSEPASDAQIVGPPPV